MKIQRKITKIGGSLGIVLPPDILQHLQLQYDDEIFIEDSTGKHGSYIAIWKKVDADDNNTKTIKHV